MPRRARRLLLAFLVSAGLTLTACVPAPPEQLSLTAEPPPPSPEDQARASTLRIRAVGPCVGAGVGTGFVIEGGRVVTNRHVVEDGARFEVETWDGQSVAVTEALYSTFTDLAVLMLDEGEAERFEPFTFATEPVDRGGEIRALGYAEAGPLVHTRGQLDRSPAGSEVLDEPGRILAITTDVRPGNSGGPALNADYEVVGVVYAGKFDAVETLEAYAIPLGRLERVLAAPMEPVSSDCQL